MTRPLYIFDLDGTLALIEHRIHFIERDRPDWKGFYAACDKDAPNTPVIDTLNGLRAFAEVRIFSGRSDEARDKTVAWLTEHTRFTPPELETALTMRAEGDYTPDDILKKQWFDGMRDEDRRRLVAVFDDRDKVVRMWRRNGVACFQVAPGNF
jgi:hypothetical protein